MTISELALATAVVLAVMAFFLDHLQDQALDFEAQQIANVVVSVHDASERYIQDEYPRIAQCFDTEQLLDDWSADPDGGQSTPFFAVPLYRGDVDSASYTVGVSDFLGRPLAYRSDLSYETTVGPEDCPVNGAITPPPVALRSMADIGLLPAGLQSLEYTPGDDSTRRWGNRGLDFRLVIRIINANTHAGPDGAVRLQVQGLLVARNAFGVFMPLELAGRAAKLTKIPEAGLISSVERTVGGVDARIFMTGSGGGWRFVMCRSFGAVPGAIDTIWGATVPNCTGAGSPEFGELPIALAATGHQDALTSAIFEVGGGRNSDPTGRTSPDDPPAGRVVALVTHTPHDQLHQVLYADDVGIPRLNRMRTHLDLGGFGMPGVGFIAATDRDGDGAIDSRLHIIGDTRLLNADPSDDPADNEYRPIVLHGPVHITGTLQVGGRSIDHRLRSGDLYVAGATVLGGTHPEDCRPIPDGAPVTDCMVSVGTGPPVNVRDGQTALMAFPASRATHDNPEGGDYDLVPGDVRVRGAVEMIDRAFVARGIEITGGRIVLAPTTAPRIHTRPAILAALSSTPKVDVVDGSGATSWTVEGTEQAPEARGEDGSIYVYADRSVLVNPEEHVVLDPRRHLLLQPPDIWSARRVASIVGGAPLPAFQSAFDGTVDGRSVVLDADRVFLPGGDRGSRADATETDFALVATAASFGPPDGIFASRVLSNALPDHHLVNWHLSGAPITPGYPAPAAFDPAYPCPPGMQLVVSQGPARHVIPVQWLKAPLQRFTQVGFADVPIPSVSHTSGGFHSHAPHSFSGNIAGFPISFTAPAHTEHSVHPPHLGFSFDSTIVDVEHLDPYAGWVLDPRTGSASAFLPLTPVTSTSFTALYHCTFLSP